MMSTTPTILLLAGTSEGWEAAEVLSKHPDVRSIASLAGATETPRPLPLETRSGGFGGIAGMLEFFANQGVSGVLDATHPFATQISDNARTACLRTHLPYARITRKLWQQMQGDQWTYVTSLEDALAAIPPGARAFLALGRKHTQALGARADIQIVLRVAESHDDDGALIERLGGTGRVTLITERPSPDIATEMDLLRAHQATVLVARNSGGDRGYAKIAAARALNIPVIMISRPTEEIVETACAQEITVDAIPDWLSRLRI